MADQPLKKKPNAQHMIPAEIAVVVTMKNGLPAVELRKVTTEHDIIKQIISAAYHGTPIILQPRFYNRLQSLNSLVDKGIIYLGEDGQHYWSYAFL